MWYVVVEGVLVNVFKLAFRMKESFSFKNSPPNIK